MKRKTIISALLVIILLFSAIPCYAQETAVISGQCIDAVPGREAVYRVSISGNPGIASFRILLSYDPNVLTPLFAAEAEQDEAESEGTLLCTQGDFSSRGTLVTNVTGKSLRVFWFDTQNATADGTLFSVHFQVNEDAENGDTQIGVYCVQEDTIDAQGEPVPVRCENGKITIRSYCPTLRLADMDVERGETFDYPVYVDDNPGVSAVKLRLYFNADALEPVTDAAGNAVVSTPNGSVVCNIQTAGGYCFLTSAWWNTSDILSSGLLFSVRLRAKSDVPFGVCTISLVESSIEVKNEAEEDVPLKHTSGGVTVCDRTEISVTVESHRADVSVMNSAASRALIAFYAPNGRMEYVKSFALNDRCGSAVLRQQTLDFSTLTWRIFLVDKDYKAIGPAYDQNN